MRNRLITPFVLLALLAQYGVSPTEWDHYDDEDLALSIPPDAVGASAHFRKKVINEMRERNRVNDIPKNRCFCNLGEAICANSTCIKHDSAACYHSVKSVYNKAEKRMEDRHMFGCATLERGSGASHFTCNQWRSPHRSPQSIACCYEGNYCNRELVPRNYPPVSGSRDEPVDRPDISFRTAHSGLLIFFSVAGILMIAVGIAALLFVRWKRSKSPPQDGVYSSFLEKSTMLPFYEDSGSGSGQATLIQRTVRQDLQIIKNIGQGRFGEVRKAYYRGSYVAVKTFYTTDEDSWKNERDVYQTHMINHENILQFVAADIWSEESMTKMLLVTDYHELGSLSDYLRREETLSTEEAIRLIHSCVCGIDHLHTAVRGTGSIRKPEIAHRDIKSKNIIVKRAGVCCIADLGLALRCDDGTIIPAKFNIQVGTKRYMAPELLSNTLNPWDFSEFKMADIYSMALVMWEVARRVEEQEDGLVTNTEFTTSDAQSDSSGVGESLGSSSPPPRAKPYTLPFEGVVTSDPSYEEMSHVVCEKAVRPQLDDAWLNGKNRVLCELSKLMSECWHANPHCRHTSLKLKKELNRLIEATHSHQKFPKKQSTSDADSGIQSKGSSKQQLDTGSAPASN